MATSADHLRHIATPSRLAMAIGKQVTGFDFVLFKWLAYVERRILEAVMDPRERFIIINVPPRSGKTNYSGVFLPAWFLGMFPDKRVMFITYSDDFSVKYGRAVRTILDRFGKDYFDVGVDKSAQAASDWQMANSFGGMLSTGVGGVLTGYGGDLIVIDDVLKNRQEAASQTIKKMHVEWYDSTVRSRLHPGGTILLTATRWAEDDLSGTLQERMAEEGYEGDQWEVIAFPALAEPDDEEFVENEDEWTDVLGRHMGEALIPERYSREQLLPIKANDVFNFSCLYQQKPTLPEGGMFPRGRWMYWNPATVPPLRRVVRAWDLATIEGGGDWTTGVKMGRATNGDLIVLERERFRRSTSEVEKAVKAAAARDGYGVTIVIEQEKAGAGKTVVEHYQRELAGYVVKAGKIEGTKEQRATPYSSMQQMGRVWLPAGISWKEEWIKEHQAMMGDGRRPRHDDQIDTAAWAALELMGQGTVEMYVPGEDRMQLTQEAAVERFTGESILSQNEVTVWSPEGDLVQGGFLPAWLQHGEDPVGAER